MDYNLNFLSLFSLDSTFISLISQKETAILFKDNKTVSLLQAEINNHIDNYFFIYKNISYSQRSLLYSHLNSFMKKIQVNIKFSFIDSFFKMLEEFRHFIFNNVISLSSYTFDSFFKNFCHNFVCPINLYCTMFNISPLTKYSNHLELLQDIERIEISLFKIAYHTS